MRIRKTTSGKFFNLRNLFLASFAALSVMTAFSLSSCEKGHAQTPSGPPYSTFRRAGGLVFVSGQSAVTFENGTFHLIPGLDFEGEVRKTMDLIAADLAGAGLSFSDVVNVTIYMRDLNNFSKMNNVYRTYFPGGNFPARATVGVKDLLGDAGIEISVTAQDR
jgi:2-iminobutanoate/2-iminopropanoate deaminase